MAFRRVSRLIKPTFNNFSNKFFSKIPRANYGTHFKTSSKKYLIIGVSLLVTGAGVGKFYSTQSIIQNVQASEDHKNPEGYTFPTKHLKHPKAGRGIVLVECGSFNPPTYLHLSLFERAKDALEKEEGIEVCGAYLSPVHEGYRKAGLLSNEHRLNMALLAVQDSDWIQVDDWEM